MDWQPIETAPKDGHTIIVSSYPDMGPWLVYWDGEKWYQDEIGPSEPIFWWLPYPIIPPPPVA